jgi:hypothetical protein
MNSLKGNFESFNVKVGNISGKLGVNMAINNNKAERCSNQTNNVMCMITTLQRKFDILMEKKR